MEKFPHLKFVQKVIGKPRLYGGGETSERTAKNKDNRQGHSNFLFNKTCNIKKDWNTMLSERKEQGLAPIDSDVVPIFLQINPDILTSDFDLKQFGIEIISEEENGFIIGASLDKLQSLEEKINGFIESKHGTGKIAEFWEIIEGDDSNWKAEHILSEELLSKWPNIDDNDIFLLEVSIAFDKPIGKEPDPEKQGGVARLENYRNQLIERDDLLMDREENFENFINHYGELKSSIIHLSDSFGCEVEINGKGLKDLVLNYPFVFDISEVEKVGGVDGNVKEREDTDFNILPPEVGSPEIGVIDSGIMEGHKYLAPAIIKDNSKSYIEDDTSTADKVLGGGHGTKVAGAILYPYGISEIDADYKLPCFIRNLRVLNQDNALVNKFPAELMMKIVEENKDCSIFNLSINSKVPFRKKHMSLWAATIDSLIHDNRILFIISTGNVVKPDIRNYVNNGVPYPDYLDKPFCALANPAQSSFGLVVGSINHAYFEDENWFSLGNDYDVSGFSRVGSGIWEHIKPDVVEFGGGLIQSKNGINSIRENEITSTELIRSTLHGGNAYGKDTVGTSFATPKVSHIVAQLRKIYPDEDITLIKSLVVQGSRLPKNFFLNPTNRSIKHFGYGLPSIERVTNNNKQRITFYNTDSIAAEEGKIYSLKIPESLRSQADEYDVLIEVTLSYTAKVRRTRQKTKSYLATWLDWTSSYLGESQENFIKRVVKEIEDQEIQIPENVERNIIPWKIRENKDWGTVEGFSRNNSTVQKDWAIIKSFDLPEELSFSVRGHKSWDKNFEPVPFAIVVSIEVLNENIDVYESIRIENEIELPVEI